MAGVNRVILIGNCGRDPDAATTQGGKAISRIGVATSETWKDKKTGEKQERTEWNRVVAFGPLAEIMNKYLVKGSKVYIEGKLQTNKWQDDKGNDRYTTEIIASQMVMLDSRRQGDSGQGSSGQSDSAPSKAGAEDFLTTI